MPLQLADAARIMRESMRDKSYRAFPIGLDAGDYLRRHKKRLAPTSYVEIEQCLAKLSVYFADLELHDFEPPVGRERLEEFLDHFWGDLAPATYNKHLSGLRGFCKDAILRGKLHGDPTLGITRARKRGVHRTIFSPDQRRAILAQNPELRDRVALRLLLDYALRKGALQRVRFEHFDHYRRQLTIFTKRESVRSVPIPHPAFWNDLERLIVETEAQPSHYLLPRQKKTPVRFDAETRKAIEWRLLQFHDVPMGGHGLHDWWYRCLERADVVGEGQRRGERMHKARHTAGQRVLDKTGNLKATQKLLGHASIQTTGDEYVDWDIDQLAATMADVVQDDDG